MRRIFVFLFLLLFLIPLSVRAQGGISLTSGILGAVLSPGEREYIPVVIKNNTGEGKSVLLSLKPERLSGWDISIEDRDRGTKVFKVWVEPHGSRELLFNVKPPRDAEPGKYDFVIKASWDGGEESLTLTVEVRGKAKGEGRIEVSTDWPDLKGPSDATFEFRIDIKNALGRDATFDLRAKYPEGWDVGFKPAWEEKRVSSVRIRDDSTKSIDVEVKPALKTSPGVYPVVIYVSSGDVKAEPLTLRVRITGSYELELTTPTGRLSAKATAGKENLLTLLLKNTGNAPVSKIKIMGTGPDGWEFGFSPEEIDLLNVGDEETIKMSVAIPRDAIAGDYAIKVYADGRETSDTVELRITVTTPTAWGWVGLGIIIAVILGLIGMFMWLRRR